MEVPLPVVEVQAVLQRVVVAPELVAAAHDVQIGIAVAIGVEEHGVDIFRQTVGLRCAGCALARKVPSRC